MMETLLFIPQNWKYISSEIKMVMDYASGPYKDDVIFWGREHLNGFQGSMKKSVIKSTRFGDGYKL